MQTTTERIATQPFHETIVEAILGASSADLMCLATLIKATKIPKGHDEITTAWNKRTKELCWYNKDLDVPANLLEQKQANTKPDSEKKGVNLDELQKGAENLLSLLSDRHPSLTTWNDFMQKGLQNLHKLTSQALGK